MNNPALALAAILFMAFVGATILCSLGDKAYRESFREALEAADRLDKMMERKHGN